MAIIVYDDTGHFTGDGIEGGLKRARWIGGAFVAYGDRFESGENGTRLASHDDSVNSGQ